MPGRKLVFVGNHVGGTGGMEVYGREVVEGAARAGWHVTVIASEARVAESPDLVHRRVPGPTRPFLLANPWFLGWVAHRLNAAPNTVVHANGALSLRGADVSTLHFCHQAPGARTGSSRATPFHVCNQRLGHRLAVAGERRMLRPDVTPRIVALSESTRQDAMTVLRYPAERVALIPHGIDTVRFRPDPAARTEVRARTGIAEDALTAIFVGGDWPRKGLRDAIDGVASAPDWQLLVVGDGDVEATRRIAHAAGVGDRVHLVGPRADVERWLAASDVFLLPTEYETFCLAAHEAAASGLPILSTRTGGVSELIEAGAGIAIERDGESVAAGLATMAASEVRRAYGAAGMTRLQHFSWARSIDRHLDLYEQILHDRGEG